MTGTAEGRRLGANQAILLAGYLLAAAGATLFSTKAIFIKLAYREIADAPLMLATRMLFALPFFAVAGLYALMRQRKEGKPLPDLRPVAAAALIGFLGYYVASLLDLEGLIHISAQLERLVLFTYPIFVMLLGWAFFKGRITKAGLFAAAITYFGLAVVFHGGTSSDTWNTTVGTLLVLASALTFALYQLLAKAIIGSLGSTLFTSIAMSAAAIASVLHWAAFGAAGMGHLSARYLGLSFATAVLATVVPSFLMNAGLARIGAQAAAMISTLSPLVTIYLAVLFLGEDFTLVDAIGAALIIAGVGFYSLQDMWARRSAPSG